MKEIIFDLLCIGRPIKFLTPEVSIHFFNFSFKANFITIIMLSLNQTCKRTLLGRESSEINQSKTYMTWETCTSSFHYLLTFTIFFVKAAMIIKQSVQISVCFLGLHWEYFVTNDIKVFIFFFYYY